jgi:hypothetical protein
VTLFCPPVSVFKVDQNDLLNLKQSQQREGGDNKRTGETIERGEIEVGERKMKRREGAGRGREKKRERKNEKKRGREREE